MDEDYDINKMVRYISHGLGFQLASGSWIV